MQLIVTLTSTSVRLPVLRHTLISIFDQSYQPDRIVLCISKEPYLIDKGIKDLPIWLDKMINRGLLEIYWVENTGPYRKLIPIFKIASDEDWIVTCDDDVIYGKYWLSSLVQSGLDNPTAIVCGRARRPVKNPFGRRQSYMNWPIAQAGTKGNDLMPIGIAGVLYRKALLDHEIMLNEDYKKLAPRQDDLWFNLARQVAGTTVVVSPEAAKHVYPIIAPGALYLKNTDTRSYAWDTLFTTLIRRLVARVKAYIGLPSCDNDIAMKNIEAFRRSFD
jgi:hypothetical protein